MKKRLSTILLTIGLFVFMIVVGRCDYMFQWLAYRNFCYVWVLIALLWLLKQDICAKWLTAGSILAIFPADILETVKFSIYGEDMAAHSMYWGVAAWIALTALSLAIGIWLQVRKWRKDHPKPEPKEQNANKPRRTGK